MLIEKFQIENVYQSLYINRIYIAFYIQSKYVSNRI